MPNHVANWARNGIDITTAGAAGSRAAAAAYALLDVLVGGADHDQASIPPALFLVL